MMTVPDFTVTVNTIDQPSKDFDPIPATRLSSERHHGVNFEHDEISLRDSHLRFEIALQDILHSLTSATIDYLRLGIRYFEIGIKARSCSSPSNSAAHHQFGIEGRRWDVDPFFVPWLQALHIAMDLEANLVSKSLSRTTSGWTCREIKQARALVDSVEDTVRSIEEGVEQIEDIERMRHSEHLLKQHAQDRADDREERGLGEAEKESRRLRRGKKEREASHDAERRVLPQMAFEQAKFDKWQKRVEGVERMLG